METKKNIKERKERKIESKRIFMLGILFLSLIFLHAFSSDLRLEF